MAPLPTALRTWKLWRLSSNLWWILVAEPVFNLWHLKLREGLLHGKKHVWTRRDFGQKALKVNKVQTHRQENHRRVRAEEKWPPTMENEKEIRQMCKCVLMLCQVQLNALNLPLSCTWVSCKAFHVCALLLVWGFGDSSWDRTGAKEDQEIPFFLCFYSFCCSLSQLVTADRLQSSRDGNEYLKDVKGWHCLKMTKKETWLNRNPWGFLKKNFSVGFPNELSDIFQLN